ncbi:MAG TPA: DUF6093 family protein [Aquihabitans sp.]|nr:DUF6093 family protein [Aquihabitans sp.]
MSHIADARARNEARLGSLGTVTRAGVGDGVIDDETLAVTRPGDVTVHAGIRCSVTATSNQSREEDRAGQQLDASTYRIAVPVSATGIRRGDTFTVTSIDADGDPDLVGVALTVVDVELRSNVVLRRLRCTDTRPATGRLP